MPRRLLVISYFHPPFAGAGGLRWQSMSRHLRNRGHTVTIVATDAFGRLRDDEQAGVTRVRDVRSNRHLRRVLGRGALTVAGSAPSVEVPPTALLTRVLVPDAQLLSWLPRALPAVRRLLAADAVDCLVTSSPPESVHLIGLLLSHRRPP